LEGQGEGGMTIGITSINLLCNQGTGREGELKDSLIEVRIDCQEVEDGSELVLL